MLYPYAHVRTHALKGQACSAHGDPASSPAAPQGAHACHACGCASPLSARFCSIPYGENIPNWRIISVHETILANRRKGLQHMYVPRVRKPCLAAHQLACLQAARCPHELAQPLQHSGSEHIRARSVRNAGSGTWCTQQYPSLGLAILQKGVLPISISVTKACAKRTGAVDSVERRR